MRSNAPVAVFIFNRPVHLARTLNSLVGNPGFQDCPIFVFADGPRGPADAESTQAAQRVAREVLGSRAEYRLQDRNMGLAGSVIAGVTELTDRFGRVIVVEDDLEVGPGFLSYMNDALERFENSGDVYQVSGYMFGAPGIAARKRAVFLPIISTWGWATWKRAWAAFDAQANGWQQLRADRRLRRRFNFGGVYNYDLMLEKQMSGSGNSWGIRWYWSVFQRNGLVCYPPQSFVRNIGMDGSGTHGRGILRGFSTAAQPWPVVETLFPQVPITCAVDLAETRRALWVQNGGWLGHLADRLRALLWALKRH